MNHNKIKYVIKQKFFSYQNKARQDRLKRKERQIKVQEPETNSFPCSWVS